MRVVAHLSDLHFGTEDPALAEALLEDLRAEKPHAVVVSGDLTQRARVNEFADARAWLDLLPAPFIAVPGNHDLPLYDVLSRVLRPYERWHRFIGPETDPVWMDEKLLVIGLNTARRASLSAGMPSVAAGRLSEEQVAWAVRALEDHGNGRFRIVVTHHPFVPAPKTEGRAVVRHDVLGRGDSALEALETAGADLLLSGHYHLGFAGDIRAHHGSVDRSVLFGHTGTALSHRRRGEPNGWTRITITEDAVRFAVRVWKDGVFAPGGEIRFVRHAGEWVEARSRERRPYFLPV